MRPVSNDNLRLINTGLIFCMLSPLDFVENVPYNYCTDGEDDVDDQHDDDDWIENNAGGS